MSYGISYFRLKTSERYCAIVDNDSKLPLFYPNLFVTTQTRNKNHSFSTMISTAKCLVVLLKFLKERNIDIIERIHSKKFLAIFELDDLRDFTQKKFDSKYEEQSKVKRISEIKYVTSETEYLRLTIIYKYIEWLALHVTVSNDDSFSEALSACINGIKSRRPVKKGRNDILNPKSLTDDKIEDLLEVVRINSPKNPFMRSLQSRNRLIILMLYFLGVRAGELLNIRISDIDFSSNQLKILRRADEKGDYRLKQPLVKTNERIIPIKDNLIKEIYDYILNERSKLTKKKKHDYLFVRHKSGAEQGLPLNYSAYAKVISTIKNVLPNLSSLTGHMLRHTWNVDFSKRMDSLENPPSEERQEKMRSYLMGWKEGSGTASHYNKRFLEEKAHEAALQLQNEISLIIKK